ncbi:long-chain acyl-CoA synthetase [Lysobacter sp. yr284]|uniref:AMP-binding protein n=1 Tax=Lysobacter sp. yr284 TaxID=1761791 RepID=UPI00089756DC|nr:AMP-binding protein [Lysobacter sp. yr284]SDY80596.1 long-chain acyl-CoA synthetase [Lysobacter sp. yr284]
MDPTPSWFASYPSDVPAQIDPDALGTIADVLRKTVAEFGARPAYSNFGKTLSFAELDALSRRFAAYLAHDLALKKGDRVAIMLPNCLQYPVALFGALRAGLVVVNVNPMYTARELAHQIHDSGAKALVVVDNFGATVEAAGVAKQLTGVITTGLGDLLDSPKRALFNFALKYVKRMVPDYRIEGAVRFRDALAAGARHDWRDSHVEPQDLAFLQYTGGTTGISKGAMLTHRNMVANLQQVSAWFGDKIRPGQETIVTALPLYHVFALTCNCLVFLKAGGHSLLITNPRDMPGFVKELQKTPFTAITGVNTLFSGLLNTPGFERVDFSQLRMCFGGGTAVQRAVAERWKQVTGKPLVEGYGLTESSPVAVVNPIVEDMQFNGAIGVPIPSTLACVMNEAGERLPVGEPGELCLQGPQVMKGYWRQPEETARTVDRDGWLHTGDIARIDERGFIFLVDRKKDMILVSGFNVYPNEVEDVMAAMPGIREAAAVGVPSEKSGEAVKLVVVRSDPALTAEQIKTYARANLTGYKVPHVIEFRNELPKSNVGKILRRELRGG